MNRHENEQIFRALCIKESRERTADGRVRQGMTARRKEGTGESERVDGRERMGESGRERGDGREWPGESGKKGREKEWNEIW